VTTRHTPARPRRRVALAAAALAAVAALLPPGTAGAAEEEDGGPAPLDFAIVVDQSASLSEDDLAREVEAAALIAQAEISDRSRAAVIGFGSSETDGQSPVQEVCPLTTADAAGRQRLAECVQELANPDRDAVGPGTDFPSAIRQAVRRLTEDGAAGVPRVVFFLTDGRLDVRDSPGYGPDPDSRQANGRAELTQALAEARDAEVAIWPLGFGDEIDRDALTAMAEGGYRGGCTSLPDAAPRMRVVEGAGELRAALQETFAAARCARVELGTSGTPPTDLYVTIPPIATDGSISVAKRDPRVRVTYFDPDGDEVPLSDDDFEGSSFQVSGQDSPVEALRVTNPEPGRWRVHLEAPEGHREQEAFVSAIWQGRLRSSLTLTPSAPRPGETVTAEVRMQTRDGVVITDPGLLEGVTVTARLAGDGFEPVDAELRDDGADGDARAGDVRFTGRLTVPDSATGELTVTSEMAAPGVTADQRPYHTVATIGEPPVAAVLTLDDDTVHPGGRVEGTLSVTNNDDREHTLRLGLADLPPGAALTVEPATVTAAPGESRPHRFTVTFDVDTPTGPAAGTLTVTDEDETRLHEVFLDVTVTTPPTWWDRNRWTALGGGALLAALAVVAGLWWWAKRDPKPDGLFLELRRDGGQIDEQQVRTRGGAREFAFRIDNARGPHPTLRAVAPDAAGAHRLRRRSDGSVTVRTPKGAERTLHPGQTMTVDAESGLELAVRGSAPTPPRRTPAASRSGPGDGSRPSGAGPKRSPQDDLF
jgi:hypothetical protein